jgi:hypothetical protein
VVLGTCFTRTVMFMEFALLVTLHESLITDHFS